MILSRSRNWVCLFGSLPMRSRLALFAILVGGVALSGDPPDLSEYKTAATAVQAKARELSGPPKQPAHLGINAEADPAGGLRVAGVELDSPAAKAGLQIGDRLLAIGGQEVRDLATFRDKLLALLEGD